MKYLFVRPVSVDAQKVVRFTICCFKEQSRLDRDLLVFRLGIVVKGTGAIEICKYVSIDRKNKRS